MMANGALVRVLIHTSVTKYLNFKAVDGSFVYNNGKVWVSGSCIALLHRDVIQVQPCDMYPC
jgi:RAB protein geranylgeranyltransferase component A